MTALRPALVITTYNQPRLLGLCLRSLTNQSYEAFDIFIADDGSTQETRDKINFYKNYLIQDIHHFWHEDHGYQKAKINNEVFRHLGNYPFVICIDGDTICHHRFIEDHVCAHEKKDKTLFMGRRIDLGQGISSRLKEEQVCGFNRGMSLKLLRSAITGETKNAFRSIRIPSPFLRKLFKRDRVNDLLGSNFSVSTQLLFAVNGYDENFNSYWGEDGDLFIRLRNVGAEIVGSKSLAIQYHIFHKRNEPTLENIRRYEELLRNRDYTRCAAGISRSS